jgi:hypothetical protein
VLIRFRHIQRVIVALAVCTPTICLAQESTPSLHTLTASLDTAPSRSATDGVIAIDERPSMHQLTAPTPSRLGTLVPLYASFAMLQTLDAHSTIRAIENGATERNPLLRDLAGHPAGLFALKAGVTASTILLTEKIRKKHPVGAIVLMAALDSFYATVVVHNYRATR